MERRVLTVTESTDLEPSNTGLGPETGGAAEDEDRRAGRRDEGMAGSGDRLNPMRALAMRRQRAACMMAGCRMLRMDKMEKFNQHNRFEISNPNPIRRSPPRQMLHRLPPDLLVTSIAPFLDPATLLSLAHTHRALHAVVLPLYLRDLDFARTSATRFLVAFARGRVGRPKPDADATEGEADEDEVAATDGDRRRTPSAVLLPPPPLTPLRPRLALRGVRSIILVLSRPPPAPTPPPKPGQRPTQNTSSAAPHASLFSSTRIPFLPPEIPATPTLANSPFHHPGKKADAPEPDPDPEQWDPRLVRLALALLRLCGANLRRLEVRIDISREAGGQGIWSRVAAPLLSLCGSQLEHLVVVTGHTSRAWDETADFRARVGSESEKAAEAMDAEKSALAWTGRVVAGRKHQDEFTRPKGQERAGLTAVLASFPHIRTLVLRGTASSCTEVAAGHDLHAPQDASDIAVSTFKVLTAFDGILSLPSPPHLRNLHLDLPSLPTNIGVLGDALASVGHTVERIKLFLLPGTPIGLREVLGDGPLPVLGREQDTDDLSTSDAAYPRLSVLETTPELLALLLTRVLPHHSLLGTPLPNPQPSHLPAAPRLHTLRLVLHAPPHALTLAALHALLRPAAFPALTALRVGASHPLAWGAALAIGFGMGVAVGKDLPGWKGVAGAGEWRGRFPWREIEVALLGGRLTKSYASAERVEAWRGVMGAVWGDRLPEIVGVTAAVAAGMGPAGVAAAAAVAAAEKTYPVANTLEVFKLILPPPPALTSHHIRTLARFTASCSRLTDLVLLADAEPRPSHPAEDLGTTTSDLLASFMPPQIHDGATGLRSLALPLRFDRTRIGALVRRLEQGTVDPLWRMDRLARLRLAVGKDDAEFWEQMGRVVGMLPALETLEVDVVVRSTGGEGVGWAWRRLDTPGAVASRPPDATNPANPQPPHPISAFLRSLVLTHRNGNPPPRLARFDLILPDLDLASHRTTTASFWNAVAASSLADPDTVSLESDAFDDAGYPCSPVSTLFRLLRAPSLPPAHFPATPAALLAALASGRPVALGALYAALLSHLVAPAVVANVAVTTVRLRGGPFGVPELRLLQAVGVLGGGGVRIEVAYGAWDAWSLRKTTFGELWGVREYFAREQDEDAGGGGGVDEHLDVTVERIRR
ncbi:hypothetical protein HDU96_010787 [Phlyctochytrium bullatum]|nr:hypothetical protein HDU96_010787 [Phlyctochytrium bullatum]